MASSCQPRHPWEEGARAEVCRGTGMGTGMELSCSGLCLLDLTTGVAVVMLFMTERAAGCQK